MGASSNGHVWVVAANVTMSEDLARQADRRGTVRVPKDTKIDVLEVLCSNCRRPYARVAESDCEAAASKDHLIGGPTGERKKRNITAASA